MPDRPAARVAVPGAVLGVQTFGTRIPGAGAGAAIPVLLIAGSAASMAAWPDDVCRRLADAGRHVIRYDHRDTGLSTGFPPGTYGMPELAADAVALLETLDLPRAHLVGASLGGMIAQLVAVGHPDRVASLTLLSTSPAAPGTADDLPPPSLRVRIELEDFDLPDWGDPAAVVEHLVALARVRAGTARPFDEASARADAERVVAHGGGAGLAAAAEVYAQLDPGPPWRSRLAGVAAPALVIHGAADPLLPPAHARALAAELPHADLLLLPGAGHDLRPGDWDTVLPAILAHTSRPFAARPRGESCRPGEHPLTPPGPQALDRAGADRQRRVSGR